MKRSESRILTTHTGSLPRSPALRDLLVRLDRREAVDAAAYTDLGEATAECELFRRAPGADKFAEAFMTAASPGVIATIMLDAYYGSHERYVKALAREMRKEYELIVTRGFVLQLDCPDLAMERARFFQDEPLDGFLRAVALHVDAINEAIGDRTRVLAGVDCGFGTFAGSQLVEESVVWTKLRALREGADLATRRLWKSGGDPWQG